MNALVPLAFPAAEPLIDANWLDYTLVAIYFGFVLGIGVMARRSVSDSIDFFLSGRSLPAWVTGLAFISANLGAVEIMGMSANGAEIGLPTVHYFWVGAIPAMLFLGVVMMPFYYGSKVRSVPEFMFRRFGTGAHLVNAISFAFAQLLIAGVNLYLLGSIVHALLGWPLWVALIVAAAIVLSYITLGGLSAAIYNEVLQFFVIVASLLPLTLIGLHRVGGYGGLKDKIAAFAEAAPANAKVAPAAQQLESWPGQALSGFDSPFWSVVGIVFGLGFVLSFGYWTTNFVEVQRAMASKSISAARKTPIIGAFPKMFVPFLVIFPGMVAGVMVKEIMDLKNGGSPPGGASGEGVEVQRRPAAADARHPPERPARTGHRGSAGRVHGRHGRQHLGLQHRLQLRPVAALHPQGPQRRLLPADRPAGHGGGDAHRNLHGHAGEQLLQHHGLPADAVRVLQRAAVRHLHPRHVLEADDPDRRMGRPGRWHAFGSAGGLPLGGRVRPASQGVIPLSGQGASFVAASTAFVVDIVLAWSSLVTTPKPASELKGLVYSETPKEDLVDPEEATLPGTSARSARRYRARHRPHPQLRVLRRHHVRQDRRPEGRGGQAPSTSATSSARCSASTASSSRSLACSARRARKTGGVNANLWTGLALLWPAPPFL